MRARLFASLAVAATVWAQDPAGELPVIRVTTRLVQVDVVVRSKQTAVTDLTKDDFAISDDGKLRKIAFFQRTSARLAPPVAANPLPSNVFTNRAEERGQAPGSLTVLLLDGINSNVPMQLQAKAEVAKFLKNVCPPDRVAIYLLGGSLRIWQDFTSDAEVLSGAFDRCPWGAGYIWNPAKRAEAAAKNSDVAVNSELARLSTIAWKELNQYPSHLPPNVSATAAELTALARYLGRIPGRKNLLWFTAAFPMVAWSAEPAIFGDAVSFSGKALNEAGVAVYPVDARGLLAPKADATVGMQAPMPGMAESGRGSSPVVIHGGKGSPALGFPIGGVDTMESVAKATGGRAFYNRNDLAVALREAADDAEVTYTLGFYPESDAGDSKRHRLKVEVARHDVDVRYRDEYVLSPVQPSPDEGKKAIADGISSPWEASGISIQATVDRTEQTKTGSIRLAISISGDDLLMQRTEQGWTGAYDLICVQRAASGRNLGKISDVLEMKLDDEHYRQMLKERIKIPKTIRPSPQAREIRVVVYDRSSGRLGSLIVPIN